MEKCKRSEIISVGDSVGVNLLITLIQRLVANKKEFPAKLIAITPVFDSSMSNQLIDEIDKKDPMLSKSVNF